MCMWPMPAMSVHAQCTGPTGRVLQDVRFERDALGVVTGSDDRARGRTGRREFSYDPLGQLTLKETVLIEGAASQTNTLRWEDYTQTAVDPSDDCTIWYVGDYYKKDATNYSSRIGGFRLPGCGR